MLHVCLTALLLTMITLVASGCGGSSKAEVTTSASSTTTTTTASTSAVTPTPTPKVAVVRLASGTPLTRAEWIKKGEAVCAKLNAQLAANTIRTPSDFARVLPQAAAYERAEFNSLVKLAPPASMSKDWQHFLTATEEWAENSLKVANLATPGNFNINTPLAVATKNIHEHLAAIAKRDGFKECALV